MTRGEVFASRVKCTLSQTVLLVRPRMDLWIKVPRQGIPLIKSRGSVLIIEMSKDFSDHSLVGAQMGEFW